MTTEEIIRLAFELGTAVAESDEVDRLKALQMKLNQDSSAYDLLMRYQEAKMKLDNKYHDGLLVTKAEEDHLRILEQQLTANSLINELIQAQESFNNLMQAVYFAMNQAISSSAGGCSSGCESCGGGCS
ncbi:MAG TPA: YlbF family regulator [Syntrophomonadaceae bacterium]|nr:YlbF family regulator [Syntrophomonadaceae bacterium]